MKLTNILTKNKASEQEEQITLIEYCDLRGIPIYHIANEGKRSTKAGAILKSMGMRKGFPDLCVPLARGKFHGLYIEMKVHPNKVTNDQKKWLRLLHNNGYATCVCYGFEEAREKIDKYLCLEVIT